MARSDALRILIADDERDQLDGLQEQVQAMQKNPRFRLTRPIELTLVSTPKAVEDIVQTVEAGEPLDVDIIIMDVVWGTSDVPPSRRLYDALHARAEHDDALASSITFLATTRVRQDARGLIQRIAETQPHHSGTRWAWELHKPPALCELKAFPGDRDGHWQCVVAFAIHRHTDAARYGSWLQGEINTHLPLISFAHKRIEALQLRKDPIVLIESRDRATARVASRYIHQLSERRDARWVCQDLGGEPCPIPMALVFGADEEVIQEKDVMARLESADLGTIHLESVDSALRWPSDGRAELARLLETKRYHAISGDDWSESEFEWSGAIILQVADLELLQSDDPLARTIVELTSGSLLTIPALSDRPDDLELIASHLIETLGLDTSLHTDALNQLRGAAFQSVDELATILKTAQRLAYPEELDADAIKAALSRKQHGGSRDPLTDGEQGMWDALYGRALSGKELADELDTSPATISQWKICINATGRRVVQKRGRGYYRPDAPPPDTT